MNLEKTKQLDESARTIKSRGDNVVDSDLILQDPLANSL